MTTITALSSKPAYFYVPMISYLSHGTSADSLQDMRGSTAHWASFHYYSTRHDTRVVSTVQFQTKPMPDFCGGAIVHSPRLLHCYEEWGGNAWVTALTSASPRAVCLETLTGKGRWSRPDIIEYAYACIARQLAVYLSRDTMRGFVGSDKEGGIGMFGVSTHGLFEYLDNVGRVKYMQYVPNTRPSALTGSGAYRSSHKWDGDVASVEFKVDMGHTWVNSNSDNVVQWMSGSLQSRRDLNSTSGVDAINNVLENNINNRDYYTQAPAMAWSNG